MKMKLLLWVTMLIISLNTTAQTIIPVQWASSVIGVSSELYPAPGDFSAAQLLGAPDVYPSCGDNPKAWSPTSANGSREFFVLGFATPQLVNTIRIYQTRGPGAVDTVYLRNASNGNWNKVYENTAVDQVVCPGLDKQLLEIIIPTTSYNVDAIRVAVNSPLNTNWNEFDAVSIANFDVMSASADQYVSSILGFSSEYNPSPQSYSTDKLKGIPDGDPVNCLDIANAWASATEDGQREYLVLGYAAPSKVNRIMIHQQLSPGAIDTIYLRQYGTNTWHKIYQATAAAPTNCTASKYFELNFTKTAYFVDAVRIAINSPAVFYYNEIDAVGLQCESIPNLVLSAKSGNWNDPTSWFGGVVPSSTSNVNIVPPHSISLNANGSAKNLIIHTDGVLNMNTAATTLTVGNFNTGGGNDSVVVYGSVNIGDGALNIGGRLKEYSISGNSWVQSGGIVRIDGNTGVVGTSVADEDYLLEVNVLPPGPAVGNTYNPTAGTILFVDPPAGASGKLMYYRTTGANLGTQHIIQYGDGVSTTAGGNAQGFINNTFTDVGSILVNNPSGTNRMVTDTRLSGIQNLTVTAGTINFGTQSPIINQAASNSGTINNTGAFIDFRNGLTNSGIITVNNELRVLGDLTNNSGSSITTASSFVTKDLVNNGILNVSSSFCFCRDASTASTTAQSISGSGTFNTSGATLEFFNNSAGGVTLNRDITVTTLNTGLGYLHLGSKNLTFSDPVITGGADATSYIVTNGTGRLHFTNLTTTEVLFPIGTANTYNPVRINNGSAHTFSAGVQQGFSVSVPGTEQVNREWDLKDETGGTVSADVTLQWNTADEDGTFNRNKSAVFHYNGTEWEKVSPTGAALNPGAGIYTRNATGVSSFSPFIVSSNEVLLPLTLVSFTARNENNRIRIGWQTEEEANVSHFEIERSIDGVTFVFLQSAAAVNTPGVHDYVIYDASPVHGMNFYRLKMVDKDGRSKYSFIVKADFDKAMALTIAPNPAHGEISIQSDKGITSISILDMHGKVIRSFLPSSNNRYSIHNITPGIYIVRVMTGEHATVQKLVIQ